MQRKMKKFHTGPELKRAALEAHLYSEWSIKREEGKVVTVKLLVTLKEAYMKEQGEQPPGYDAKRKIVTRFMDRYHLCYRSRTHTGTRDCCYYG